jgi:MFS family permease
MPKYKQQAPPATPAAPPRPATTNRSSGVDPAQLPESPVFARRPRIAAALRTLLPPRAGLRRDLWVSAADAAAFSVMVGCGENYIPAFALELGHGPVAAGMTATVPVLAGACLQSVTPWGVRHVGTNRGWVVGCTLLQAASFVPLIVWALTGHAALWQVLVAASLYWSAGMAGAPAWNAWMGTMVPERMRTPYFAQRHRLGQFAAFAGFVAGGLVLQWGESRGDARGAFAVLFAIAAAFRLVSTGCLLACRELKRPAQIVREAPPSVSPPLADRHRRLTVSGPAALVVFLWLFAFACQISAPYFTPFMRRELGFSYLDFMTVGATAFLAKAFALPALGRLGSRIGSTRLLWASALAVTPLALLWVPTGTVTYLVAVQVLAGCCWAGYELAVALLFFDAVAPADRTSVVTVYNVGHAVATVSGATAGAALLEWLGEGRSAYVTLFVTSAILRAAVIPLMARINRGGRTDGAASAPGPGATAAAVGPPAAAVTQEADDEASDFTPGPGDGERPVRETGLLQPLAQPLIGKRNSWSRLSRNVRALP